MKSIKNKLSITIFSIVIVPLLTNCVKNGYIEFYDDYTAGEVRPNKNSNPEVYGTSKNNIDEDVHRLQRNLYYVIGESFFMGASDRAHNVTKAAISKDADLVLVYEEYRDSTTTNTTMSVPDTQTSYHSGSVSSSGGYGSYYGTTTTYGSRNIPISITHHYYDFGSVFFRKFEKKPRIGINGFDCGEQQKKQIQKNQCLFIGIVYNDTPAFRQNLMEGDIFISINGYDVYNIDSYYRALGTTINQNIINFKMMRNSRIINIALDLRTDAEIEEERIRELLLKRSKKK